MIKPNTGVKESTAESYGDRRVAERWYRRFKQRAVIEFLIT